MEEKKTKEYRLYQETCEGCGAEINMDYEVLPNIRVHKIKCPGCGQKIAVRRKKRKADDLEEQDTQQKEAVNG